MGGSAPRPDKNIGIAAMKSAETGQMMMDWMKSQAEITNQWASEDRLRDKSVFMPMQDAFIAEAKGYDTPERRQAAADAAAADVNIGNANALAQRERQAISMGVRPDSGRFISASAKAATDGALGEAGARNLARRQVEDTGRSMRASAINMGSGLAVNPGTSIGLSNGAGQAGFGGAMQGYGQQANILNQDFQNRMQAYQANQGALGSAFGALGTVIGAMPWASSEKIKHDKVPVGDDDALGAIRSMPVEAWTYNEGSGDGQRHIGPYAEDFSAATGQGDGSSIDPITMNGVLLGAVRALDKKVSALAGNAGEGQGGKTTRKGMPPTMPAMGAMRMAA